MNSIFLYYTHTKKAYTVTICHIIINFDNIMRHKAEKFLIKCCTYIMLYIIYGTKYLNNK